MAVLCDRTVFSSSSNSWNSVGLSTFLDPGMMSAVASSGEGTILTTAVDLPSSNKGGEQHGVWQQIPFGYRDSDQ
jgi:hypothetical protein